MRRGSDNNSVVLEVAGFGITLSGLTDERLKQRDSLIRRSRVNLILLGNRETGFNILTGLDYGAYPAGTENFSISAPASRSTFPRSWPVWTVSWGSGAASAFRPVCNIRSTITGLRTIRSRCVVSRG